MGGRGAFLKDGTLKTQRYKVVDFIEGIKILRPKDPKAKLSLPERSVTPNTSYASYYNDGTFRQFITFDENRMPRYQIDYGMHQGTKSLHVHHYINGDRKGKFEYLHPGDVIYERHKRLFIGVPIPNERNWY